jgi:hypothetical protein
LPNVDALFEICVKVQALFSGVYAFRLLVAKRENPSYCGGALTEQENDTHQQNCNPFTPAAASKYQIKESSSRTAILKIFS